MSPVPPPPPVLVGAFADPMSNPSRSSDPSGVTDDGSNSQMNLLMTRILNTQRILGRTSSVSEGSVDVRMVLTKPVRQNGPSCGFSALNVLGQLLHPKDSSVMPDQSSMMTWAKNQGYTRHGEMFSAVHLAETLCHFYQCELDIHDGGLAEGSASSVSDIASIVTAHLLKGNLLIVPYDKGPNHEPVLRNGHSAHWCVVLGTVIFRRSREEYESRAFSEDVDRDCVYCVTRHGGSSHYGLWRLRDLVESCLALREARLPENEEPWVISNPQDLRDLRGKIIIVKCEAQVWNCTMWRPTDM